MVHLLCNIFTPNDAVPFVWFICIKDKSEFIYYHHRMTVNVWNLSHEIGFMLDFYLGK